jgi:AraC family transcriptional activator of tynA and feaB
MDVACNTTRVERSEQDIRRDGMEYYCVTAQATGDSTIIHDDRVVSVAAGDVVLFDSTRPVTIISPAHAQWVGLPLPRQNLVSHLGFEP